MSQLKRFTLRNEYFGGLLHDANLMNATLLNPQEYELVKNLFTESGRNAATAAMKQNPEFKKLIEKLVSVTAIDKKFNPINIRNVIHPIPLPDGILASPLRVYDTYGFRCNLNCTRCLNKSARDRLDENKRTLEDTKKIMKKFYGAGTMEWRITGGEPTAYPDLIDVIKFGKSLGMAMMINTNACWPDKIYAPLLNVGLTEIIISIEGKKEVNDFLRGEGVYDHIIKTMNAIKQHNAENPEKKIAVTMNMTVGSENVESVKEIVKLAAGYKYNVNFVPARPYGRACPENLLSTSQFMEFSRLVQEMRVVVKEEDSGIKITHRNMDLFNPDMLDKRNLPSPFNYSNCGALSTGFGLSPDGRVNACSFTASNEEFRGKDLKVPEVSVYDAWLDIKMDRIRRAEKIGCTACEYYKIQCEGKCVAMVLAEGGRIEGEGNRTKLIGKDRYCFAALLKQEKISSK